MIRVNINANIDQENHSGDDKNQWKHQYFTRTSARDTICRGMAFGKDRCAVILGKDCDAELTHFVKQTVLASPARLMAKYQNKAKPRPIYRKPRLQMFDILWFCSGAQTKQAYLTRTCRSS